MLNYTESAKLVRRENDDRRSSGGGIKNENFFSQKNFKAHEMEDDLYDKIPSYLTVFSHGYVVPIKDHNDVTNDYILNNENCGLRRNLYSLPNRLNFYENGDNEEYSRLPAYTMDLSQSLLYDEDFDRKIKVKKSDIPHFNIKKKVKNKLVKIEKESVENRKVVFIGHIPPNWTSPKDKIESILNEITPSVKCYLKNIDIKTRFHNNLDSFGFIHFTESNAAFITFEYFQNNDKYAICNASLAGRDEYCNGRKYSDIDGSASLIEKIGHF